MRNRELRGIAKAIARCEKTLSNENSTKEDRAKAMQEIVDISSQFESLEDMQAVDEMVLDLLEKGS